IIGQTISQALSNARLAKTIFQDRLILKRINKALIFNSAKRYKDFPKYSMPAVLMNTLANNLLNFFLPIMFSIATLGQYSLVNRILGAPSITIGNSFGQVFMQQATHEKRKTGAAIKTFHSTLKKLVIISIIPFTALFIISEKL